MTGIKTMELAYLSGLFDAEGCVHLARIARGDSFRYILDASICQTDREGIDLALNLLGGNFVQSTNQKRTAYYWRSQSLKGVAAISLLRPFCIGKAEQIDFALAALQLERPRNGNLQENETYWQKVRATLTAMKGPRDASLPQHCLDWTPAEKAAYAAGFIDGDGCILCDAGRRNARGHRAIYPRLEAGTNHAGPLRLLAHMYGGSIYRSRTENNFRWKITCGSALAAIEDMLPYMLVRRDQAAVALGFKPLLGSAAGGARMSDETRRAREQIYIGLSAYKTKNRRASAWVEERP